MAGKRESQNFGVIVLLLLLSFNLLGLMEARRLTDHTGITVRLSVGMMKYSGPSKGGGGHRGRLHARIIPNQIKDNSGPSPGVGHHYSGANSMHH
ncbi:hypothetical protein D8674_038253 [Pyrus ussuriensis x Pyrus communis]|uniref:Uncharacterized protein n=1 Tax=Pyrus ussuriensis x Pyrus communis TaxID=2448454 RepID=A0A5N5I120_9ROSA|nr:hypothetical protein D8674_038253 [Pyrus ussuriensis x Pyrus communis]